MHRDDAPVTTDLVLIGGGHSHLFVLRYLAMNSAPGLRVTLVTRDLHTPYSGMLPGYIAGHYDFDQTHIDLLPLARAAGARVIHAEVDAIDCDSRQISVQGRPPLDYDLLSINIGSRPATPQITTSTESGDNQFAVKPVDRFIDCWQRLQQRLSEGDDDLHLAVVGGGAGGVELALSLRYRVDQLAAPHAQLRISLVTDADRLLQGHNTRVCGYITEILQQRGINVYYGHAVSAWDGQQLSGDFASPLAADAVVWVTTASPAGWLRDSGLALDEAGFIRVNASLQSESHPQVFAAGDIASVQDHPRPRSGVFAVRQGIPLARNLMRQLQGQTLHPFVPQSQFLSLISTGDHYAIASRGQWALRGRWCWRLKDYIDRKFVRRFSELPQMPTTAEDGIELQPMHCGGCGSKVGSDVLEQVLQRVNHRFNLPPQPVDDAAVIELPAGMQMLQTIDHFRSFVDDPYLFGRIAANHALGDLFAMGVEAHSALVVANVVYASEEKQSQDLFQLMAGVVETLQQHDTRLLGGHSGEAAQMSCGLSVNGFARRQDLLLKQGIRPGDLLILTKPLGSGILFAADMRGQTRGAWLDAALEQMLVSSRDAAVCLRKFQASACTDITGFGLAGHLFEMARASACSVELDLDCLPLMDGAVELSSQGIASSLQPQNIRIRHSITADAEYARHAHYPLIFDPQTAGGLLASVAAEQAQDCLLQLQQLGYSEARIVGRALPTEQDGMRIRLRRL